MTHKVSNDEPQPSQKETKIVTKCKMKSTQSVKYRVLRYAITFNTKEKWDM